MYTSALILLLAPLALSNALLPRFPDSTLPGSGGLSTSPNPALIFRRQSCAAGKTPCGTGCMPAVTGNTCCVSYYCDSGRLCDTDGACTCLATEKKCGTGCIPSGASCCPLDLRYCDVGKYCSPVKGYCCNNGEDPAACGTRQGFTIPASVSTSPFTSTSIKPVSVSSPAVSSSSVKPLTTPSSSPAVVKTSTPVFSPLSTSSAAASSSSTTSAAVVVFTATATTTSASTTTASRVQVSSGAAVPRGQMDLGALLVGVVGAVGMAAF